MDQKYLNKRELRRIHCGMSKVAKVAAVTFGPAGRKMLASESGELWVTDDTELLIGDLQFQDPYEEIGRKLLAELNDQIIAEAGSGGKTAILIAETFLYRAIRAFEKDIDLQGYLKGLSLGTGYIYRSLDAESLGLDHQKGIELMRTVMGREYPVERDLIGIIGNNVPIFLHPFLEDSSKYEVVDGCVIPCGIATGHKADGSCLQLRDCNVLVLSYPMKHVNQLARLLLHMGERGSSLAIFAPAFSEQVLMIIRSFQRKNVVTCLPIMASAKNRSYQRLLNDVALLTGAKVLGKEGADDLGNSALEGLGHAREITASFEQTFLQFESHVTENQNIEKEIRRCHEEMEASKGMRKEALRCRLMWLRAKIGVIYLGIPPSPPFYNYRKELKKALNTYLKSKREGVVPGGGVSYLHCVDVLRSLEAELADSSVRYGVRALRYAVLQPFKQIISNAGGDYRSKLHFLTKHSNLGFDAERKIYADLAEHGVLDSKMVLKKAIELSFSLLYNLLAVPGKHR
ncbi:TCP-1/cpn60 chaperonin family protein [Sphingobacterium multivorum]